MKQKCKPRSRHQAYWFLFDTMLESVIDTRGVCSCALVFIVHRTENPPFVFWGPFIFRYNLLLKFVVSFFGFLLLSYRQPSMTTI